LGKTAANLPTMDLLMNTQTKKPQFLLLLHQPNTGPAPTPDQMKQIMDRFTVWMRNLSDKGIVVGTNGLESTGTVLRGPRGTTLNDGPFAESKEIVGGYVLITADSFNQAVEIARDCPGLDYQMAVEVRPVKERRDAR
jgi:hypothetical protein